jgi:hypothetical protein
MIAISDGVRVAVTNGKRWASDDKVLEGILNDRIGLIEWVRNDIASPEEQMVMDATREFPDMRVIWEKE